MAIKIQGTIVVDDTRNIANANSAVFTGNSSIKLPSGDSDQRPDSPVDGMIRYNTEEETFEGYSAGDWGSIGGGAEAGGAIHVNSTIADKSYTIAANTNGFSVGPVTVANGVSIVISNNQRWVII